MSAFTRLWLVRWSVASALAGALAFALLLLLPAGETAARDALSGLARVIDGDTLEIAGERVRLEGIDAPEMAQTCGGPAGAKWACGRSAAEALEHVLAGAKVECRDRGTDKYGRMLGVCFAGRRDINAQMVREGQAWAFVKYSHSYVQQEAEARALKVGIWQGEAEPAWVFRARRWAGAEEAAPKGCAIKGNVSTNGRIYHLPWSPWYGKVRIDEKKGERWFCSESEAMAAGWRPAAVR
jgi:endonuclease YncB( thermonuclease family)